MAAGEAGAPPAPHLKALKGSGDDDDDAGAFGQPGGTEAYGEFAAIGNHFEAERPYASPFFWAAFVVTGSDP